MAQQPVPAEENPFELQRIRQLVRLMRDNDLSEIDLQWDTARLRLKRGATIVSSPMGFAPGPVMSAPVPAAATPDSTAPSSAPVTASNLLTITSPIVGTFYAASGPDVSPFVSVGSRVTPETIVCIIEAMKVFNEIPSAVSGTIREVLVENGAAVEYGQALFRVDPS